MRIVTWILHFYPCKWRERYYEEMLEVLEQHTISMFTIFDLLLGALDARLDPSYRSEEGFMLSRIRDARSLSALYICSLALFQFSVIFWMTLNMSFVFSSSSDLAGNTEQIAIFFSTGIVPGVSLLALLFIAVPILLDVLKNRRRVMLLFAILCLGISVALGFKYIPNIPRLQVSFLNIAEGWLYFGINPLVVGLSLFVTGVKGLQAIRERRWWLIGLVLLIDLFLPICLLLCRIWNTVIPPVGSFPIPQGALWIGGIPFASITDFIRFFWWSFAQYALPFCMLGALILALCQSEPGKYTWRFVRGFGAVLVSLLIVSLALVMVWDVSRWLGNDARIFQPDHGIWPLFGGQWFGPLLINAFVLMVALGLVILALVRSFAARPLNEPPLEKMAA
jgi:hypothetical protein